MTPEPGGDLPGYHPRDLHFPMRSRYPCGSLVYNNIWYYGTYCLLNDVSLGMNWPILGPFVGFRVSYDMGKTWKDTPHTPSKNLF